MLCYAILLGCIASRATSHAKVRNPAWMGYLGVLIGFAGWYFQWAAWFALKFNMLAERPDDYPLGATFLQMTLHPIALFEALVEVSRLGNWTLVGNPITGFALAALWLVELIVFIALPGMFGHSRAMDPFSEASNSWAKKIEVPRRFAYIDEPQAVPDYLQRHPDGLLSVLSPWQESGSPSYAKVTLYQCQGEDSYLSITNTTVQISNNKTEESRTVVLAFLRMPGLDPDALMHELMEAATLQADRTNGQGDASLPEELETALSHLHAERYDAVLATANPYVASDQLALRTDANRLCALASCSLAQWTDACRFWDTLFKDEPSAHNALQLATSSVMAGDVARGESWLERALAMNITSHEMPAVAIETNFVTALTNSGNMRAALPYLERIKELYVALKVTDPTFLFVRQVPRFDIFLDKSMPIVDASLQADQKRSWYESMMPHLDDRGQEELAAWMDVRLQAT